MVKLVFDIPDLYEATEAAQMIGIGYATLYRWIKAGKLIPVRVDGEKVINRRTLIPISEIKRLQQDKEGSPS